MELIACVGGLWGWFWGHLGLIWGAFWSHLGGIFEQIGLNEDGINRLWALSVLTWTFALPDLASMNQRAESRAESREQMFLLALSFYFSCVCCSLLLSFKKRSGAKNYLLLLASNFISTWLLLILLPCAFRSPARSGLPAPGLNLPAPGPLWGSLFSCFSVFFSCPFLRCSQDRFGANFWAKM